MLRYVFVFLLSTSLLSCGNVEQLQPLESDAVILAFGDSLTYGTGTSRDKAYPAVLEQLTGHTVINAGVPGEVSSTGLLRLPGLIKQHRPDLIILFHGANDILRKLDLTRTSDNIQKMIDLAKDNDSQVILIGVPEFSLFLNTSPIYETLAERNRIPIEKDIMGDILGSNKLKSDHVHPNEKGYRLLAEKIALLLTQTGAIANN